MGSDKGGSSPPDVTDSPEVDTSMYMGMMNNMMMQNQAMQQQMMQQQMMQNQAPATPEIYTAKTSDIDWTEKNAELNSKARADFTVDASKKRGRDSTILTSPLADEETTSTTKSVLAGK